MGFVSLGCAKATVDSERILTELRAEGYEFSDQYDQADVVVVNTCGFIESAVEESLAVIEEAVGTNGQVIVTGCLGARSDMLMKKFPSLLAVTGPHDKDAVLTAIHEVVPPIHAPLYHLLPPGGIKLTPRHYAYLKISEGCNHKCSFCIIPSMRGRLASRSPRDIVEEAASLREAGVRELLVVSQDTSAYGIDLKGDADLLLGKALRPNIVQLSEALAELDMWVRLHYVYPYRSVDRLVELMSDGLILPYLDVPFQHSSPKVLRQMKRPASGEDNLERVRSWRALCPDIAIRSTFIVGFPGETDEDFQHLLEFLQNAKLDRVGCFSYSPVEGAIANNLANPVDPDLAEERREALMATQALISSERLQLRIGTTCAAVIDEVTSAEIIARSYAESPDVDGVIRINPSLGVKAGDQVSIKITDSDEYDLFGELTTESEQI
ncbi:MAG: 30S ribosomal protein S12 methylthiotransferase RimO [Proteobacteria bacterium]|nr:30S ribosomal protein S12 methylthiotransferase RimO [Pseudomonadota bacterium]MBT5624078.1 30S ribosomal protein S12 methylthiotransferase RimO [Pseudomonadota bacterium]MBT6932704.1 30S ribosomal protein S12 methylthiotransferase RimO [Pseudomonadota bacterium]MBT7811994.1 30S ribosomal protein S12 methylthiotransferase RimO [Pseudomonadota bacterium]